MINKKSTFFLGVFIFLIPFTGFPSSWKSSITIICGIILIILSVKISLPKKHSKNRVKREKVTPVFVENIPIYTKDASVGANAVAENKDTSVQE